MRSRFPGISGSSDNSGDSVTFSGVVALGNNSLNGAATFTVTNSLLLPGVLNLGNVTSTNTTAASTQTLTIAGAGVTTLGKRDRFRHRDRADGHRARPAPAFWISAGATSGNTYTCGFNLDRCRHGPVGHECQCEFGGSGEHHQIECLRARF